MTKKITKQQELEVLGALTAEKAHEKVEKSATKDHPTKREMERYWFDLKGGLYIKYKDGGNRYFSSRELRRLYKRTYGRAWRVCKIDNALEDRIYQEEGFHIGAMMVTREYKLKELRFEREEEKIKRYHNFCDLASYRRF